MPLPKTISALALAGIAAGAALAQLDPDTVITEFRLPLFGEEGYRTWQLKGATATYVSKTQIRISELEVGQYPGAPENPRIATLSSPEAVFHFDSQTAYGPGELKVSTEAFELKGSDWIWDGKARRITLNQDVSVTLFENIGDILK